MEILAALEIKKMLVDRLVNLLSRGYVLPVVKYMAQCWRHADTDISLIRSTELDYFFHSAAIALKTCKWWLFLFVYISFGFEVADQAF